MAYKVQSSFSAGELDPVLQERTTLSKYNSGLNKGRGFVVGKTGRLVSLPGTTFSVLRKEQNQDCVVFYPDYTPYEIELTINNIRINNLVTGTFTDVPNIYWGFGSVSEGEDSLKKVQFASDGEMLYMALDGQYALRMVLGALDPNKQWLANRLVTLESVTGMFVANAVLISAESVGNGTGFDIEYAVTYVIDGEESQFTPISSSPNFKRVITATTSNTIMINFPGIGTLYKGGRHPIEMRVYQRPLGGGQYGYIGNSTEPQTGPGADDFKFKFVDYGQEPSFDILPPAQQEDFLNDIALVDPGDIVPRALTIYQKRVVVSGSGQKDAVFAFRSQRFKSFVNSSRDFPLTASSTLAMKPATSNTAEILRLMDTGGLTAFTTQGVFSTPNGPLFPETAAMTRKGNWVIDENIPPLAVPGGFLFVEKSTGAVIQFNFSLELDSFNGSEITIFSDHLFRNKRVKSWAFQSGLLPLVWAVMDDGTVNILTFLPEQEMRAWTWMDTDGFFDTVGVHKTIEGRNDVYFTVDRNGNRVREKLADRFNVEFLDYIGCHSAVVYKSILNSPITAAITGFSGTLTGTPGVFANTAGNGAAGSLFRFFAEDGSKIDFLVTSFTNTGVVAVDVVDERTIPAGQETGMTVYKTFTNLTGLNHLEGKDVYVKSDGFVIANPLNVEDDLDEITVAGGGITLDSPGAIVIVGLPAVNDIQTLDVDTVEQQPALLASVNCNKVYLKLHESRGVWVGHEFPEDDTNAGMQNTEGYDYNANEILNIEAPIQPFTKRVEVVEAGSWDAHGKISIRHVDGHPVEILSIIPDLTVERRN